MICSKCNKTEATYTSPDNWCDSCWNDWWFDIDYHTEKLSPKAKRAATADIVVARALTEFKQEHGEALVKTGIKLIFNRARKLAPADITDSEINREINKQTK